MLFELIIYISDVVKVLPDAPPKIAWKRSELP